MKLVSGLALIALLASTAAEAATFRDGQSSYTRGQVTEAEAIYATVQADDGATAADRASAARERGRIAWLVDGDADRALARLSEAEAFGDGVCQTGELVVRVLREADRQAEAMAQAQHYLPVCTDADQADLVRLQAVRAAAASGDGTALARAQGWLGGLTDAASASLPGAHARLALGLARADAAEALEGWRGYFWLSGSTDVPPALHAWAGKANETFRRGLAHDAGPRDQLRLVELLLRAGFMDEARRLSARHGLEAALADDPDWRRARAFLTYHERLTAAELAANRRMARQGAAAGADLLPQVYALTGEFMQAIGVEGDPQAVLPDAAGFYGTIGETDGYPSAHLGHIVRDDRLKVAQYGRTGEIRFIELDRMWANGFESWLWDGGAATGGWASRGTLVVQIRPRYADGPLRAWELTYDSPARRRFLDQLAADEAHDLEVARKGAVAHLPGLARRLRLQATLQIAQASAQADPHEARAAFLKAYAAAVAQHSILLHEGRHVLDQSSGINDNETLEVRAKLSELAQADYPRLPLAAINADTIGGPSAHGQANARLVKAYIDWVAANADKVAGYDPALPAAVQLDRLSDDQIRAIARSLDPWAAGQARD